MCGRFGVEQEYVQLALRYQAVVKAIDPGPRYNIAPTQTVAVIVPYAGERYLAHHRWGLVPSWAKDLSGSARMINARAETVAVLPAFRDALVRRRCVIPASRFYEWQSVSEKRKVPHAIQRADGAPLSFAGLWSSWRDPGTNERVLSCAIVTTAADGMMRTLHDRVPVILDDDAVERWLDPDVREPRALLELLVSCPDGTLSAYPVSRLVNDVRNDGPALIEPETDEALAWGARAERPPR